MKKIVAFVSIITLSLNAQNNFDSFMSGISQGIKSTGKWFINNPATTAGVFSLYMATGLANRASGLKKEQRYLEQKNYTKVIDKIEKILQIPADVKNPLEIKINENDILKAQYKVYFNNKITERDKETLLTTLNNISANIKENKPYPIQIAQFRHIKNKANENMKYASEPINNANQKSIIFGLISLSLFTYKYMQK